MRALRRIAAVAAIVIVAAAIGKGPFAADPLKLAQGAAAPEARSNEGPFGGPPPPQARSDESPFGGPPPPKFRGLKKHGVTCKTASVTCTLASPQPIGGPCTCPGSDGAPVNGTVAE